MRLKDARAFNALKNLLTGKGGKNFYCPDNPPFERLRKALKGEEERSPCDIAILIRHALLYENIRRGDRIFNASLDIPLRNSLPGKNEL